MVRLIREILLVSLLDHVFQSTNLETIPPNDKEQHGYCEVQFNPSEKQHSVEILGLLTGRIWPIFYNNRLLGLFRY